MMSATLLQVRVDEDVKQAADELFAGLGMDTATAVRLFLAESVRAQRLPFDPASRETPNRVTGAALGEADQIASGDIHAQSYRSFKDYRAALGM
ncbi:MAG: type II toxin-antitoxin system RelB/DinJ family antitoxin [Bifidobacteriaceae bacterium]|jgi:DNA-damage-inducible protein J|nr:type II toxin-antitoxin system RelB/DinJ family antitoxin [Bifidobacteriaceae bacterium]